MTVTYVVPPKPPEPIERYQLMTDAAEIAAMIACDNVRAPIGKLKDGAYYGTVNSLRQYREQHVEFNV
jgi:hypothetical protein